MQCRQGYKTICEQRCKMCAELQAIVSMFLMAFCSIVYEVLPTLGVYLPS